MSQRPDPNDSTTFTPRDATDSPSQRTAPGHVDPADTRNQTIGGPTVGGEPAAPGTRQYRDEVDQNAKTPTGITTGLMWTVGIVTLVAIVVIFFFAL